jgi:lysophospholipid acyltransferase (LPLAT)-like uncharacterized protein
MPNMKIRSPWLIHAIAFVAAFLIRLWMSTLRYRHHSLGPDVDPWHPDLPERYIYAFWHEYILLPAFHKKRSRILVLISQHADGQLIAEIAQHFGFEVVRGSTTRGGIEALRQLVRTGREVHVAVTPDGPRGPRRRIQPGLIYLASRTGLPIVPVGAGYERAWRARSWDRFAFPKLRAWASTMTGSPIRIPLDADKEQLESYRQQVEDAVNRVTATAENWSASRGKESIHFGKEVAVATDTSPMVTRQAG